MQYIMEIPPDRNVSQIENGIKFEEQTPSHFVKSSLSWHNGKFTNLVTFEELADDAEPGQFMLALATDPAPAGFAFVWSGPMIVSGTNTMVSGYRQ
ncbi:MAG: hypothetical protein ING69_18110 [Rhodocyclaceae bacterium]|nr:hypothetical protein [Rhodocyclaceae bacterium]MCA3084559.1 hypothetical protein [Rhodocyclaceae bacterium]